jgi:DNA helicase TIP49 (TBP-interacting protein)
MNITLIEVTEEELAKIIKEREAEANRLVALEALENIKALINTIHSLGYHVRLPEIGGSYIRKHNPNVTETNIMLTKW